MAISSYQSNGKNMFRVTVKIRDSRGKQIFRSRHGITSERKAEETEFELKKEIELIAKTGSILDWKSWLEDCLKKMRLDSAPSTVIGYRGTLEKWANPIIGAKPLNKITRDDIYEVVYEYPEPNYTPNARKDLLKKVKRILQVAVDDGIIDRNPAIGIKVRVPEIEQKVLTCEEVKVLLSKAKEREHPFYPVWVAALSTGMRSGELYALHWTDIDFENQLISVSKQWTSKNGFCETKTRKNRVVPVSSDFLNFLKEHKLSCDPKSQFVLPHLKEWTNGEQAKVISEFCKAIEITPIKFHDLRATFITNLLSHGVSLAKVMAIVGHSEIKTTNVYLRKAGVEIKGATECLGYKIPSHRSAKVLSLLSN
ncbi:MAG: tyrosine-type recombinase/integrase [Bdellovibrionota bacterium]